MMSEENQPPYPFPLVNIQRCDVVQCVHASEMHDDCSIRVMTALLEYFENNL